MRLRPSKADKQLMHTIYRFAMLPLELRYIVYAHYLAARRRTAARVLRPRRPQRVVEGRYVRRALCDV